MNIFWNLSKDCYYFDLYYILWWDFSKDICWYFYNYILINFIIEWSMYNLYYNLIQKLYTNKIRRTVWKTMNFKLDCQSEIALSDQNSDKKCSQSSRILVLNFMTPSQIDQNKWKKIPLKEFFWRHSGECLFLCTMCLGWMTS